MYGLSLGVGCTNRRTHKKGEGQPFIAKNAAYEQMYKKAKNRTKAAIGLSISVRRNCQAKVSSAFATPVLGDVAAGGAFFATNGVCHAAIRPLSAPP